MKVIMNFTVKKGKVDLNWSSVIDSETYCEKRYPQIINKTPKGWDSKKPLYIDGYTVDRIETLPNGREIIRITDEEYNQLTNMGEYNKSKVWESFELKSERMSAEGMKAKCRVMHDPYDTN